MRKKVKVLILMAINFLRILFSLLIIIEARRANAKNIYETFEDILRTFLRKNIPNILKR